MGLAMPLIEVRLERDLPNLFEDCQPLDHFFDEHRSRNDVASHCSEAAINKTSDSIPNLKDARTQNTEHHAESIWSVGQYDGRDLYRFAAASGPEYLN